MHAPEVEAIAKGKARTAYKFGVKVGIISTLKGKRILGARSFPNNPYDVSRFVLVATCFDIHVNGWLDADAVYHRSYEEREPIEVRISYDELVILSFPGPDRSIKTEDFEAGRSVSSRYRNRRIGEFLKELDLTEGRSTGVPKILKAMAANGSPPPRFETDADRLACVVRLPVHPLTKRPDGNVTDQVTDQVTGEIARLLAAAAQGEHTRHALQEALGLKHTPHFRQTFLLPALEAGLIEMTLPDKPRSSKQRYRLTAYGQRWLDKHPVDTR